MDRKISDIIASGHLIGSVFMRPSLQHTIPSVDLERLVGEEMSSVIAQAIVEKHFRPIVIEELELNHYLHSLDLYVFTHDQLNNLINELKEDFLRCVPKIEKVEKAGTSKEKE